MKLRVTLAVALALFALLTLLDRFVLLELLARRITVPLLVALAEALAVVGVGAAVRRAQRIDLALDLLIGYPVFGAALFLVATLKVSVWTLTPVLIAGAALAIFYLLRRGFDFTATALPPLQWSVFAVLAVLACAFVAAQAPPSSLDELAYHLAVPHTWMLEGRAVELPLLSHSYFPLGVESADLLPLALLGTIDGGVASHFLHLFAAIATAVLIARRTQSWLVTAAIVSTPALAITAGWSLVDWPLAGLFVALYVALEDDERDTATAATAAGLLTKYTFLPFALLAWALKKRVPKWIALVGLIFFARNLILTGNPVAPFLSADAPHVSGYRAAALSDYVFESTFVDEALGAALIALPAFAVGAIATASALLAVILLLLGPSSRILVPLLVVPSLSAASAVRRRAIAVFVSIAVVMQTFLVIWFTARGGAFTLIAGTASEQEYLRKQRGSYATLEWLNAALPPGSRTLLVGHAESYWLDARVRGGGNFDGPRISRYLDVPTPEGLHERLRRDGITHVAIVAVPLPTAVAAKKEERQTTLSPGAQRMLARMLDQYAANVTSHANATLFTLR